MVNAHRVSLAESRNSPATTTLQYVDGVVEEASSRNVLFIQRH